MSDAPERFSSPRKTFFLNACSQKEQVGAHSKLNVDFLPFCLEPSPVVSRITRNDYLVPRDGADVSPGHLPSHAES